jgi:hypothetical protein
MSDKAMQLAAGAAVVVLGYALYQHFKPQLMAAKSGTAPFGGTGVPVSGNDPTRPDPGFGFNPIDPGDLILSGDLINGTIADYYARQVAGGEVPFVSDLFDSAAQDYYNVTPKAGPRVGWW